jgi:hypothetical protein
MKSTTTPLTVATTHGPREVEAFIVGDFAIHREPNDFYTPPLFGWTLTHRATGYAVLRNIRRKRAAERLAKDVAAAADWDFTDPSVVTGWSKEVNAAIFAARTKAANA